MLLIFDLDDTLYQSFELIKSRTDAIAKLIMKKKKLSYEKAENLRKETQKRLKAEGREYTSRATFKEIGISPKYLEDALNSIEVDGFIKKDDSVIELLRGLSKMHDIVILSNSPKDIVNKTLEVLGVGAFVKRIYCPDDSGIEKPNPAVFKKIAQDMGYDTKDCVSIGDSVHKEIIPAKAVGMKTVLLLVKSVKLSREEQREADFIINDLKELPDVLEQISL